MILNLFIKNEDSPQAMVMVYSDGRRADIKTKYKKAFSGAAVLVLFHKFVNDGGLDNVTPGRYFFAITKRGFGKPETKLTPVK